MFGKNKKTVENNIETSSVLDKHLKPKKKLNKYTLIVIGILVLVLGWFGFSAFKSYSKILTKNNKYASPILSFFGNINADQLNGEGDGRINILLLGQGGVNHPGGNLTDTIQVVSIDPTNNKMATLSIPRDLYVKIPNRGGVKINQVYSIGEEQKQGEGANFAKETISEILDLPIHYYIKMDFDGFEKLIDQVGGVDVYVDKALYDPYYPAEDMVGYEPFYMESGNQHMNGNTALKYSRSRETTSDFDRSRRQQQILVAFREKVFSLGILTNPSKMMGIMQVLGDHLRTDMQTKELERMLTIVKDIDTKNIASRVLDNSVDGPLQTSTDGGYYLVPKAGNYTEIQRIAHELFTDPYLQKENAKIEVLNGTQTTGKGKEASDFLESYGYNIVSLEKADKIYDKTVIYDYSNNKYPFTLNYLSDRYKAEIIKKPSNGNGADITLIIGEDQLNQ